MVCLQLHATPITDLRDLVSASSTLTRRNPPIFFFNVLRGPSNFPGRFEKPACSSFFPIRSIGRYSNGILPNYFYFLSTKILLHGRSLVQSVVSVRLKLSARRIPLLFVRSTSPNVASLWHEAFEHRRINQFVVLTVRHRQRAASVWIAAQLPRLCGDETALVTTSATLADSTTRWTDKTDLSSSRNDAW